MNIPDVPTAPGVQLARWIFILAGLYGVPVIASMFFITPTIMPKAPQQQPEIYGTRLKNRRLKTGTGTVIFLAPPPRSPLGFAACGELVARLD